MGASVMSFTKVKNSQHNTLTISSQSMLRKCSHINTVRNLSISVYLSTNDLMPLTTIRLLQFAKMLSRLLWNSIGQRLRRRIEHD